MKAISPSRFADSGGCAKSLYYSCPDYFKNENNNYSSDDNQNEKQKAGTIVHNIVQYVFVGVDANERKERYNMALNAIENTKNGEAIDELIININGNKNLEKGLIGHQIRTLIWNEAPALLDCTYNLLKKLEEKINNSKGKWNITAEIGTRDIKNVKIKVLQEEMIVRTSIDLVFVYGKYVIIGEIKTGSPEPYKLEKWELQVQLMMKTWEIKYPDDKVHGFIINGELDNRSGFKRIRNTKKVDQLEYLNKESLKPGYMQCKKCIVKDNCEKAILQ